MISSMLLSSLADVDDATYQRQIAINLTGTFNTLREAARRLRNDGRISTFPRAWLACTNRPMASMPPPRRPWKP